MCLILPSFVPSFLPLFLSSFRPSVNHPYALMDLFAAVAAADSLCNATQSWLVGPAALANPEIRRILAKNYCSGTEENNRLPHSPSSSE
jgi:hypothetical protein